MSDVRPVVVPVEVEVRGNPRRAVEALGDDIRRASEAPGGPGPSVGGSGRADAMTVAGALQQFAQLQQSARQLIGQFATLGHVVGNLTALLARSGSGGPPITPLAQPAAAAAGAPGGGPPPAGGGGAGPGGAGGGQGGSTPAPTWVQVLQGVLSANALERVGNRVYSELTAFGDADDRFRQATFRAAAAGGFERDLGAAARRLGNASRTGLPSVVDPFISVEMQERLQLVGATNAANRIDRLNQYAPMMGGPGAVEAFATNLFRTTRSDRSDENLATIAKYSYQQVISGKEFADQITSLNAFFRSTQGMRRVSEQEENETYRSAGFLRSLPGGIGEGDGATDITQSVHGASKQGLGKWLAIAAYMREHPGKNPLTNLEHANEFAVWNDARGFTRKQLGGFDHEFADPAEREYWLRESGTLNATQSRAYARGTRNEKAAVVDWQDRRRADDIARAMSEQAGETPGGRSLQGEVDKTRTQTTETWMGDVRPWWNRLYADNPVLGVGGEGLKAALGGGAIGYAAARVGRSARNWWRGAGSATSATSQASTTTARAAAARGMGRAPYLLPGLGGLSVAKDAYDAYAGTDPTNTGDLVAGGFGALLGGAAGFAGGAGFGAGPGALAGYGIGKELWRMLQGLGGGDAHASLPPGVAGGDGWQQAQVDEHLTLLRMLVDGRRLGPEYAGRQDRMTLGGAASRELAAMARGDIDPTDPRIAHYAALNNVPLRIAQRLINRESGFRAGATSPKGAMGLTQLMPDTARELGVGDPYDPDQNLDGGMRYLRQQFERFGAWPEALAAYNAGPGNVRKYGGVPPFKETQKYVDDIMRGMPKAEEGFGASWELTPEQTAEMLRNDIAREGAGESRAGRRARLETDAMDREFGRGSAGEGGSNEITIHLLPEGDLAGMIQPGSVTVPGAERRVR